MSRRMPFFWAFALLAALPAAGRAEDDVEAEDRWGSIVQITTTYQTADYTHPWRMDGQETRTGSGCVLEGQRVLTNAHVVSDHTFVQVRRAGRAERTIAKVTAVSHELDLALLSVEDPAFFEGAVPLELGQMPRIGDPVRALGFPEGGTRITVTEGIVSRIDRGFYAHSYREHLLCQIDAAINAGSSGGPVVGRDGRIAGVAFQTGYGENQGYMVPPPVIRHFFRDLEDGAHDGVPVVPFAWQTMDNPQLRAHYRLPDGRTGVLITRVAPAFLGVDALQEKDVLLSIDGTDVANDGSIALRRDERILFPHVFELRQVGETVPCVLFRDGAVREVTLTLDRAKRSYGTLIPRMQYDERPRYYVAGGLVFSPLTANYFRSWASWEDVPLTLRRYYDEMRTVENAERQEVVVLIDYLADALNVGYDFEDCVVKTVNGRRILSLEDVVDAIESHEGETHRIAFEEYDWEIVLDRARLEERNQAILERYAVPHDRSADLRR